ncbi:DUF3489 domain-containing protein [Nordella sp. HKS 07]|uniref:DUF3489 domain-containing protein n=1 Tax=Nordella sp. HKS 07 TaxID=2712222 RepID=UPI0019D07340|nr:DUF3489 domain-containing protein [Nordella sp. HKS 07]
MTKIPKSSKNAVASTKAGKIINLLQRNTGATIAELSKATGWQAHSVRGFYVWHPEEEAGTPDQEQPEGGEASALRHCGR